MKFSLLLLAAGLCGFSAASAQTTPAPTPTSPGTASPSAVPSGMAPQAADPNGAVTPSEVFTKGAPRDNNTSGKRMKMRKKGMRSVDKGKMKAKMPE